MAKPSGRMGLKALKPGQRPDPKVWVAVYDVARDGYVAMCVPQSVAQKHGHKRLSRVAAQKLVRMRFVPCGVDGDDLEQRILRA